MKIITALFALVIIIAGCNGAGNVNANVNVINPSSDAENNLITFKVDGIPVKSSGWNISRFVLKKTGQIHLAVSSNMHEETKTIKVNVGGTAPGSYLFVPDDAATTYGHYYPDFDKSIFDNYGFISGAFIITAVDTVNHLVNASFAGKLKNKTGQVIEITDGRIINGKLKKTLEAF